MSELHPMGLLSIDQMIRLEALYERCRDAMQAIKSMHCTGNTPAAKIILESRIASVLFAAGIVIEADLSMDAVAHEMAIRITEHCAARQVERRT